jgi:TetR/AcrR family transcriptional repressor of lmrAB and yxaGH operons
MVAAGVDLFAERGFASVSMIQVVEKAEAPRGSIYYHFPGGKNQLGVEVAANWRHEVERLAFRLASRADSAESFLMSYLDHIGKILTSSSYGRGCPMAGIMSNLGSDEPDDLREAVGDTFTVWIASIAKGLVSKGLNPAHARHVAAIIVVAIEGLTVVSRATHTMEPFAQVKDMVPTLVATAPPAKEKAAG